MTQFTISSFNVKNLIGPNEEYYQFQKYTPEEYAWKKAWMADQLVTMNADIVCFQEIFDEASLRDVIAELGRWQCGGKNLSSLRPPDGKRTRIPFLV